MRVLITLVVLVSPGVAILAWLDRTRPQPEVGSMPVGRSIGAHDWRKIDFAVIGLLAGALSFSVYLNLRNEETNSGELPPVTALIADFDNRTGETVFDGVLEQLLNLSLAAAPYIALFDRSQAESLAQSLSTNEAGLPEAAARLVAVRQAIEVVLSGSVERAAQGYSLRVTGLNPITGDQVFEFSRQAADRDRVPEAVTGLAQAVREELGSTRRGDGESRFASRPLGYTVTSLEAAKLYADANNLDAAGDFAAAADLFRQAAELQPDWMAVYGGWAIAEFNMGRIEEAERLLNTALALAGNASEGDRLFYLSTYYSLIREDYENAVETLTEYLEIAPASAAGRNNLAVAAFYTRDFERAQSEGAELVELFPNDSLYRSNFALYAMYAGDFETAAAQARQVLANDPAYGIAYLPLAISALEEGETGRALQYYQQMAETGSGVREGGAEVVAITGKADALLYMGRVEQAREELLDGTDRMRGQGFPIPAIWQIQLAESYLASENRAAALEAARATLALSEQTSVEVAAALVLLDAGEPGGVEAAAAAEKLSSRLSAHSRAYGLMLRAAVARQRAEYSEAVDLLQSALDVADLWRIRLELGRTYLDAGNYADAIVELERCRERRGEAVAMFLDDVPTYRYLAELPYWTARAQTGLGMDEAAAQNYEAFLALRPDGGMHVDDARERLAAAH